MVDHEHATTTAGGVALLMAIRDKLALSLTEET